MYFARFFVLLLTLICIGAINAFSFGWVNRVRTTSRAPQNEIDRQKSSVSSSSASNFDLLQATKHFLSSTALKAAPPGSNRRNFFRSIGRVATIASIPSFLTFENREKAVAASPTSLQDRPTTFSTTSQAPSRWADPANERAKHEVIETTQLWLDTVTSGKPSAPADTAKLYAKQGVLWGTVSEQLRVTPEEIRDYFDYFAALPGLRVAAYQPYVRVFGKTAINDGYYIFAWNRKDGQEVRKNARYSFVYEKGSDGKWLILDHHSSLIPNAPPALKQASTVTL